MGNIIELPRLAVLLALSLLCACAQADPARPYFDIPAQPVAPALNEFARQADVTLIFSYDVVSGLRARPLQGRFPVDEALALLLRDTPLSYGKSREGAYLIFAPDHRGGPTDAAGRPAAKARMAETMRRPVSMSGR